MPASSDCVSVWIATFLNDAKQADVLSKLQSAGTDERHVFVVVPGFSTAPFEVDYLMMDDGSLLPRKPPDLPGEVTHVWVASSWDSGRGMRWSPHDGWNFFQKVPMPTSDR